MTLIGWIVLGVVVGAVVGAVRLGIYFKYMESYDDMTNTARNGGLPTASLSFDEFLKFYNLNPNKWNITYVDDIKYGYGMKGSTAYRVMFNTYSDYKKFREWQTKKKLREREEKELTSNLAFCDQLKKDIQKIQEDSHKQIVQSQQQSMDLIQQYFANERAKKENKDFGYLDPTCWPSQISDSPLEKIKTTEPIKKPEVGKIYRRVNDEHMEYGFMQPDGKIHWATDDGVKKVLATIYGKYDTIYDVPKEEMPWGDLIKKGKEPQLVENGVYQRWNAEKGKYEQGFKLANGEICWVGSKIISNPAHQGVEHVSGSIYKRWNAKQKIEEYGFKNKDGSYIWACDVVEG